MQTYAIVRVLRPYAFSSISYVCITTSLHVSSDHDSVNHLRQYIRLFLNAARLCTVKIIRTFADIFYSVYNAAIVVADAQKRTSCVCWRSAAAHVFIRSPSHLTATAATATAAAAVAAAIFIRRLLRRPADAVQSLARQRAPEIDGGEAQPSSASVTVD